MDNNFIRRRNNAITLIQGMLRAYPELSIDDCIDKAKDKAKKELGYVDYTPNSNRDWQAALEVLNKDLIKREPLWKNKKYNNHD